MVMMIAVKKKAKRGGIVRKSAARTKKAKANDARISTMRAPMAASYQRKLISAIDNVHNLQNMLGAYRSVLESILRRGWMGEREDNLAEAMEWVQKATPQVLNRIRLGF